MEEAVNYKVVCYRTRLTLTLGERRDEGTYYCVSKNELGITRANIQVFSKRTEHLIIFSSRKCLLTLMMLLMLKTPRRKMIMNAKTAPTIPLFWMTMYRFIYHFYERKY